MEIYDLDAFEFDQNNNGIVDVCVTDIDTTGDGVYDTHVELYDTNDSGLFDTAVVFHDTNGDGVEDMIAKMHDYNEDGELDSMKIHLDSDGDGHYEVLAKVYDSQNSGELDTLDLYVDLDGEGTSTYQNSFAYDRETNTLIPNEIAGFEVGGTMIQDLEQYNPQESNPDAVSGEPDLAINVWECQGDTNRCALFSQKFVIEEVTGQEIDIEEFADIAKDHGWFTEEGGTSFLNMNNMLDYYGIENDMSFNNSISDIESCLNNGGKVIVSIDADEIWYGADDNMFSPESSANHAVEVIGIDHTDPNNPMVILNDSGSPMGKGEMIPLDVFEGAWEDGDCQMISVYA